MNRNIISQRKLSEYHAKGYWKGMTLEMCREFESVGFWPGITLHEYFDESVKKFPHNKFIIHEGSHYSYKDANDVIRRLTVGLLGLGFRKGDLICVLLHNCPEMVFLQIALSRIGSIIQPIHLVYREYEIRKRIEFCEAKAIVIPDNIKGIDYVGMMRDIQKDTGPEYIFVAGEKKDYGKGIRSLRSICETDSSGSILHDYLENAEVDANDILLLNFTSGTETAPKGFLHTHNTILGNTEIAAREVLKFVPGKEVLLTFSPMTHTFGHMITYFACIKGAAIVLVDTYDPGKALALIENEKVSFIQGTPTHFLRFLEHEDFPKYNLSSLKTLATGGSAIPPPLVKRLEEKTGARLTVWFGMGEDIIHMVVYPDEEESRFLNTVGKPMPGAEIAILDPDGNPLPTGEVGEIGFRGSAMFLGYFKNPEKTDASRTSNGWLRTGDTGFLDEGGYLRLFGRMKDMINRGGSKIFPLTIENALSFHPKINSVSVVGVPDPELGERVCACVIPAKGLDITLEEILDYMKEKGFGRYEMPERIEIMSSFPMTPTGKVKKDLLQEKVVAGGK